MRFLLQWQKWKPAGLPWWGFYSKFSQVVHPGEKIQTAEFPDIYFGGDSARSLRSRRPLAERTRVPVAPRAPACCCRARRGDVGARPAPGLRERSAPCPCFTAGPMSWAGGFARVSAPPRPVLPGGVHLSRVDPGNKELSEITFLFNTSSSAICKGGFQIFRGAKAWV